MATSSEVKAGLDEISAMIKICRKRLTEAKASASTQVAKLNNIPTQFSNILATINAFTPDGTFEELSKDELAKMTTEFLALVADASLAVTDLGNRTEF